MADIKQQARELLPCPFCGSTRVSIHSKRRSRTQSGYAAGCMSCGVRQGSVLNPSIDAAATKWNLRAALASQPQADQPEVLVSADGPHDLWVFLNHTTNIVGYSEVGPEHARLGEKSVKYIRAELVSQTQDALDKEFAALDEECRQDGHHGFMVAPDPTITAQRESGALGQSDEHVVIADQGVEKSNSSATTKSLSIKGFRDKTPMNSARSPLSSMDEAPEPCAFVPIHPTIGPLWCHAYPAGAPEDGRPARYERRALYFSPARAPAAAVTEIDVAAAPAPVGG